MARTGGDVARRGGSGALAKPAAVYDSVTEGLIGWQFLRTWRWAGYFAIALIFALICSGLALWQFDRGRGASADNLLYASNFVKPAEPLTTALPGYDSYRPDQVWQRVTMRGTWDAAHQYYVRNMVRSGETGFDVVTALKLSTGGSILIDRGWVASTASDPTIPAHRAAPPAGTVDVVARLQPSQAKRGEGGIQNGFIESIDLSEIAPTLSGRVYSAAYGVIVTPTSGSQGLSRIQATPPAEGVGYHYSYMIQWIAFILIGFFLLWRAALREFRRINVDDPEEQKRAAQRARKAAAKPFTDEELEDEALDGYIPLSRWAAGRAEPLTSSPARPALTGTPIPFDDEQEPPSVAPHDDVFVLESGERQDGAPEPDGPQPADGPDEEVPPGRDSR